MERSSLEAGMTHALVHGPTVPSATQVCPQCGSRWTIRSIRDAAENSQVVRLLKYSCHHCGNEATFADSRPLRPK